MKGNSQGVAVSHWLPILVAAGVGEHQPVKKVWVRHPQHPLQKMVSIRQIITTNNNLITITSNTGYEEGSIR